MTTLLVVNPAAGAGQAGELAPEVIAAARKAWGDVEPLRTTGPGDAVCLGRKGAEDGVERIIVVGGDGTIHETANGMLSTGLASLPRLGVVPVGTGNDFAKLTGTHRQAPRRAIARLAAGAGKMFDVGLAWGEYFVNSLGLGFDATVASQVPHFRHLWRPLVYPAAVARSYQTYRPIDITIEADEVSFTGGIFCIEIGIGKSSGGGFFLTPGALPDDGLFDVCLVRLLSHWGFVTRMPAAFWGRHTRFKEVRMMKTTRLSVRATVPLLAHFDGEVRTGPETIDITMQKNRLPVMTAS
jgi:diacylglycerol kinase (ATP)